MIIKFNQFKSFSTLSKDKAFHELKLSRINLIYGLNNSGKSSIIQLINLLSKNFKDFKYLKTNFKDMPLGQFNNILNDSFKEIIDNFEIELYEDKIRNFQTSSYDLKKLPKTGLSFNYEEDINKSLKSTGKLKEFEIIFNYKNYGKEDTSFKFEQESKNSGSYFRCKRIKIAQDCELLNFKNIAASFSEHKGDILKRIRTVKSEYDVALAEIKKLNIKHDCLDGLIFDKKNKKFVDFLRNFNKDIDSSIRYLDDLKETRFNFDNTDKIEDISIELTQERFFRYLKFTYKRSVELANINFFLDRINNLIDFLTGFIPELKKFKSIEECEKTTMERAKLHKIDVKSKKFLKNIFTIINRNKLDTKNLNNFLNYTKELQNTLIEIKKVDISFYIDQFYRSFGNRIKSTEWKLLIFMFFDKKILDIFVQYCKSENNEKDINYLREIFTKSLKDIFIKNLSDDFEVFGIENNILQLLKVYSIEKDSPIINFENLNKLMNRFTTMSPFHNITKINNKNCDINQRIFEIQNFEEESISGKYDQTNIINNLYNNKKLLDTVNEELKNMGFKINLDFRQNLENEGVIIPTLNIPITSNKNKNIGYLADAGQAIRKIIPLIYHVTSNEDSVLTLEEPEANIHPQYQANLADLVTNSLKNNNNEFVIETHSELLVLRFLKLIREKKLSKNNFTINFIKYDSGSEIIPIEIDEDGSLKSEWPGGFFKERLYEF